MQQVRPSGEATSRQYRRDHGYGRTYEAFAINMRARLREYGGPCRADGDHTGASPPPGYPVPVCQDHRRSVREAQETATTTTAG